jgi:hypothetical protein
MAIPPLISSVTTFFSTASRGRNAVVVGLATAVLLQKSAYPAGMAVAAYIYFQPEGKSLWEFVDLPFRTCYNIGKTFTSEDNFMHHISNVLSTARSFIQTPAQKAVFIGLTAGGIAAVPYLHDATNWPVKTPRRRAALIAIGVGMLVYTKFPSITLSSLETRGASLFADLRKWWEAPIAPPQT